MSVQVGQQLGNYRLLRLLGRGEFATVFVSEQVYLKTQCAIKVLHLGSDTLDAFLSEARMLAHLVHPHIVRVLDFGVDHQTPFLVMDYAPDGTLRQLHPLGTQLSCTSIVRYVQQVAAALQYAHDHQVIHRDLKPENMLVGRNNEILLADFGIAALTHQGTPRQSLGGAVGTCTYMAPEQFLGRPGFASDQYALGIVVYEWLTGDLPFRGTQLELMAQHQSRQPPPLRSRLPDLSPTIEQVVLRALSKDAGARFPTIEAFAQALSAAMNAEAARSIPLQSATQRSFQFGRLHTSPRVGRDQEWATLYQLVLSIEQAHTPHSHADSTFPPTAHCALLTGELGIGKTRLAEDLGREAQRRGWTVAWSRGYVQEGSIPYRLWTEVLRNLLAAGSWSLHTGDDHAGYASLRRILPEFASLRPQEAAPSSLSPQQERARLWESMREVFAQTSQHGSVLVVLDDLHYADESSLEVLMYLVRHLATNRILFLGTYRHSELTHSHPLLALEASLRYEQLAVKLALQPLTQEHIGEMVSYLPTALVREIQRLAGGNPLFAEELARAYSEEPKHERTRQAPPPRWSSLPGTITAALEKRIGQLSVACQQLLSTASALGDSFTYATLRLMLSVDQQEERVLDLLDEAMSASILAEEGTRAAITFHFWHPLIAVYLYERLSAARRVHLHRAAAATLQKVYQGREEEAAAAIVSHLIECGSDPLSIVRYAEMAGNHAFALSAYPEAARQYQLAIEHWEEAHIHPSATRRETDTWLHLAFLVERLGECLTTQGAYAEARQCYQRVIEIRMRETAPNPVHPSAALIEDQREAQLLACLWSEIGRAWRMTGDYLQARQSCERAEEILRKHGVGVGLAMASVRLQQSYIDWQEGYYQTARRRALDALQLLENALQLEERAAGDAVLATRTTRLLAGDPLLLGEVHEALSNIASGEGQLADALSHLHTALGIYERHGQLKALAHVTGNLGFTHLVRGEDAQAKEYLARAFALTERMGDLPDMAVIALNLGEVAARAGALPDAEAWFRRSLLLTQQIGDRERMVWCYDSLATVYRDQGKLADALECICQALLQSRTIQNTPCLGLAMVALGNARITQALLATSSKERARYLSRARAVLTRALTFELLYPEPKIVGRLALAQVALLFGNPDSAWQEASRALAQALATDLLLVQVQAQRLLATTLVAQGKHEQADRLFEQVLQMCRDRHMDLEGARTLQSYGASLLERCDPTDSSCVNQYHQALDHLQEARRTFARCHAAFDYQRVEHVLALAPRKKPFSGFF